MPLCRVTQIMPPFGILVNHITPLNELSFRGFRKALSVNSVRWGFFFREKESKKTISLARKISFVCLYTARLLLLLGQQRCCCSGNYVVFMANSP